MKKIELSIVTLTWNSEEFILNMLNSLKKKAEEYDIKIEIIVVDNGSKDQTLKYLKERQTKINELIVVPLPKNYGTTISRNIALKIAKGEKILVVDSDVDFKNTNLKKLLKSFEEIDNSNVQIVHPKLIHPSGEIQNSALLFPTFKRKMKRFLGNEKKDYSLNKSQKIDYAISAAWLIKKELFEKIGYLDEKIFYAPEDAEYCTRVWNNGYEVWYYPEVEIIHHYQQITRKNKFTKMWFIHLKGLIYYWIKYRKMRLFKNEN